METAVVRVGRDVALLQEVGCPPDDLAHLFRYEDNVFRDRHLCDRWSLVVQLSDRVEVERLRQVPPGIGGFGASGIGTMAAAGVTPHGRPCGVTTGRSRRYTERPDILLPQQRPSAKANRQFDYDFVSRGFHERVKVRALNGTGEWCSSDHCRLLIEVATE